MKRLTVVVVSIACFFVAGLVSAASFGAKASYRDSRLQGTAYSQDRGERRQVAFSRVRDDRRHRSHLRRNDRHRLSHPSVRRDRHYRNNYRKKRHRSDAFVTGLVLGGVLSTQLCPDDYHRGHRHHQGYSNRHSPRYFRDNYGACFRLEYGRAGEHYIRVPAHKCPL